MKVLLFFIAVAAILSLGASQPARNDDARATSGLHDKADYSYKLSDHGKYSNFANTQRARNRDLPATYGHDKGGYKQSDYAKGYGKPQYGKGYGMPEYGGEYGPPAGYQGGYRYGPRNYGNPYGAGYGYGGVGSQYGPPPEEKEEKKLNPIDKLYENVNDITNQNKFASEAIDALEARLSLMKKFVDQLDIVMFPRLTSEDGNQNSTLERLDEQLTKLMSDLDDLDYRTTDLEHQNMDNVDHTADISSGVTYEKREDVRQTGQVARLHATVNGLKAKLFTVLGNEFQVFGDKVETTAGKLQGSKRREKSRMCEAGTVTLAGFNRAEYIFQSEFEEVPGVLYSVTGLKVNLNALATPYSPGEPNSAGVVVVANPSRRSVTFLAYDLSFGNTAKMSVDIDFQVCTIGPGSQVASSDGVGSLGAASAFGSSTGNVVSSFVPAPAFGGNTENVFMPFDAASASGGATANAVGQNGPSGNGFRSFQAVSAFGDKTGNVVSSFVPPPAFGGNTGSVFMPFDAASASGGTTGSGVGQNSPSSNGFRSFQAVSAFGDKTGNVVSSFVPPPAFGGNTRTVNPLG